MPFLTRVSLVTVTPNVCVNVVSLRITAFVICVWNVKYFWRAHLSAHYQLFCMYLYYLNELSVNWFVVSIAIIMLLMEIHVINTKQRRLSTQADCLQISVHIFLEATVFQGILDFISEPR